MSDETTEPTADPADDLKIVIATPCTDSVRAGYALDLAMLYGLTVAAGVRCAYVQNRGTIIPQQRATLVTKAMEFGATHLLFIDSDMRFPKDALFRLLAHNEPIVAANYARRRHPALPTAEVRGEGFVFTEPESEGLAEVTHCGMGMMLIRMDVFHQIAEPWFQIGYTPKDGQYVGEDFFFCEKVRKAGLKVLIDQSLSREVRHTGEIDYTHAHTMQARDATGAVSVTATPPHPRIQVVTNGAR